MSAKKTSRRTFLEALSLAGASLPLLRATEAIAAPAVAPLRLILVHSPFQVSEPFYHPQVSATNSAMAPDGTSFYLDFPNSTLAPLAPFQSELIIFRGLTYGNGLVSHSTDSTVFTGANAALTPVNVAANSPAITSSSIDQYLFTRMAQASSLTPFVAGFDSYQYADHLYSDTTIYNAGNPVGMVANPQKLYNQLFANFTPSGNKPPQAAINAANRRQQTIGLVQKYLQQYQGSLSSNSPSQSVLQSHVAAAKGLSAQIAASTSPSTVSCSPPGASSIINDPSVDQGGLLVANAAADAAAFVQIITLAFACDITRFCTFQLSDAGDGSQGLISVMPGLTTWDQSQNWHGAVTHLTTGEASNPLDLDMALFKRYFMTQVASLLTALKAAADPYSPTQTLYDNTVVLIGSEGPIQSPGTGPHGGNFSSDQVFILAGGCGGYFKMGRLVMAGGSTKPTVRHNALLTNIINTFERNQQQFNPAYVPKILQQYGDYGFSESPTDWLT